METNKTETIEARRVINEKVMEFDFPTFVLTAKISVKFVVCVEYSDTLWIYQFSNAGLGEFILDDKLKDKWVDQFSKRKLSQRKVLEENKTIKQEETN